MITPIVQSRHSSGWQSQVRDGFSLVEVLIVVAIIVLLGGILFASGGPAREKARQSVCLSHFRQIGHALTMYRQDYAISDSVGTTVQMGLPPVPETLVASRYLSSQDVLKCPNQPQVERDRKIAAYSWQSVTGEAEWQPFGKVLPFSKAVALRGLDFAVMTDGHHDFQPSDRPMKQRFLILLRLDGRAEARWLDLYLRPWQW